MLTHEEMRSPARAGTRNRANASNRLSLVVENPNPRQPWRARLPMRRVAVSPELAAYLSAMSIGGRK